MKTCTKCKIDKDLCFFYKRKVHKDGLSSCCKACQNAATIAYRLANPNKAKKYTATYKMAHPERVKAQHKAYKLDNPDKIKSYITAWGKSNPGIINAKTAKRRAKKLQATPIWLTKDQHVEIKEFYILAKELQWLSNESLQVDHIIPLQGENVSGLHVPWNLQIIPKSMNILKAINFKGPI